MSRCIAFSFIDKSCCNASGFIDPINPVWKSKACAKSWAFGLGAPDHDRLFRFLFRFLSKIGHFHITERNRNLSVHKYQYVTSVHTWFVCASI